MEDIPKTLSSFNEEIWLKNSISLFLNNNTWTVLSFDQCCWPVIDL
jgi:hypothetical protein